MSMSSSSSQQPQQQPGLIDPNTSIVQAGSASSSSHSNGSFGTVFIVLAAIIVISAIACCLGRLCNKRHRSHKEKPPKQNRPKGKPGRDLEFEPPKRNHSFRPGERENRDLEFGFDKNIAASKPAGNGETKGFKQFGNGDIRFEPKFTDFGDPKFSA